MKTFLILLSLGLLTTVEVQGRTIRNLEAGLWCQSQDLNGTDYTGDMHITRSGFECQSWASQYPHEHTVENMKGNSCRNPDEEKTDEEKTGVWCYTTDKNTQWELCDVPLCDEEEACPEADTYFYGNDVGNGNAKSWQECSDICRNDNKCTYWTFWPSYGHCYKKSSDSGRISGISSKLGFVSGSQNCGIVAEEPTTTTTTTTTIKTTTTPIAYPTAGKARSWNFWDYEDIYNHTLVFDGPFNNN